MDPHDQNSNGDDHRRDQPLAEELGLWRRFSQAVEAAPASCPDLASLAAYLDGALAAAERDEVEGHVAECAPCRAAIIETRAALAAPEMAPAVVIERAASLADPPAVVARIGGVFWRRAAGWGLAAAASIAVGFVGYDLGLSTQTNDEDALAEMTFGLVTPIESEALDVELFALVGEVSR